MELMKEELDEARQKGVQEGIREGMRQGSRQALAEAVLDLLSALGEIPEDILEMIQTERDMDVLKSYNKKTAMSKSIEEFRSLVVRS